MHGRRVPAALVLGVGFMMLASAAPVSASETASEFELHLEDPSMMGTQRIPRMRAPAASRARMLSTLSAAETTYVGFTPGHSADNYWSIWAGTNAEGYGRTHARTGVWDFEPTYSDVHGDSLQGWWPYRFTMLGTGGQTSQDVLRPWRALDYGNNANYSGPFGSSADKRTFGVVGVWHVDTGDTGAGIGQGVGWTPLVGIGAAWMGLRRSGDTSHLEDVARGGTGNALNEDVLMYQGGFAAAQGGSDKKFPGYGSQMDQMLYRDIDLGGVGDTSLTVSFRYRTAMSTGFTTSNTTRTGWFVHDPYVVITGGTNPNFISNHSTTPAPPVDSLMVYLGVGAEDSVRLSDGQAHFIYDPQRRWFGEVLRSNEGLHRQILSVSGTTAAGGVLSSVTLGSAVLAPLKSAGANRVRLVFRVKTNQSFDDANFVNSGYGSGGVGAAIIDDVRIARGAASLTVLGAFDDPAEIDQRPAVPAFDAWKSTGKPPQAYHHPHDLANLNYADICGEPGSATRFCNLNGVVVSAGNHDRSDENGHSGAAFEREPYDGIISPTIQLCGPFDGPGGKNRMGITADQTVVTDDYYIRYDLYFGYGSFLTEGNGWALGFESYPAARSASGVGEHKQWGQIRFMPTGPFWSDDPTCMTDHLPAKALGMVRTTNPSGVPDSVRMVLRRVQECYRFTIPNCVTDQGLYWDNISLAMVDGATQDRPMALTSLLQFQDTFPFSDTVTPGSAASFDTAAALIKVGVNIAGGGYNVPGDTATFYAAGAAVRVDLVFRILPGPGNYVDPSLGSDSQLKAVPTAATPIPAPAPGVTNFWSSYLHDNGAHGTPGGHPVAASGPLAGQKVWSPHVWNSARCDSAEINVFVSDAYSAFSVGAPVMDEFMTAYHETELADPHRGMLGLSRNICFAPDSANVHLPVTSICGSGQMPPGVTYPPAWSTRPGSGKPASCTAGNCVTNEGTKIIPDGLLTPGAHVQYFFRREDTGMPGFVMAPDTNVVSPQPAEANYSREDGLDGHRWQQFGVLPDRWKSTLYRHPVLGTMGTVEACMLVIDQADGEGNEMTWVSTADSIGATAPAKFGAHNGWHAPGNGDPNDPASFLPAHIGQPGTTWDLYSVRGGGYLSAGSMGSRLVFSDPSNAQIYGKRSRQGPSLAMLSEYYSLIVLLTGDANSRILGPNDVGLLEQWAEAGNPAQPDRGLWVMGQNIVEDNAKTTAPSLFNNNVLGVGLRDASYPRLSGNPALSVDLLTTTAIAPEGVTLGLVASCKEEHDVLQISAGLSSDAWASSYFEAVGANAPYIAGVLKQHSAAYPWIALTDAFDLDDLHTRDNVSTVGRRYYVHRVLTNVFGAICNAAPGPVVDAPPVSDAAAIDFVRVHGNPATGGRAVIRLGMSRPGRLEVRLYDIAGRLMKTLIDRGVQSGERTIVWDGTNAAGERVPGGVYFARVRRDREFETTRRIVMIR